MLQPSVNAQRAPPKGGKFFYMDYAKEDTMGYYYASSLLGTEQIPFKVAMSTS